MASSTSEITSVRPGAHSYEFPLMQSGTSPADSYQRMIIERWDDDYIYGVARVDGEDSSVCVCYTHGSRPFHYDWSYMRRLFYQGAHLNLIHPRLEEGILYPELLIFEPDYLVDISTVAYCFTDYAESPLVHLVDRLCPSQRSEAIMMGHLAGQMLDEQVHPSMPRRSYRELVTEFWRRYAISLLTTDISRDFHSKAQKQRRHIEEALRTTLPQMASAYRPGEGVIEPSFFSEMLGLQGRMDYLQWDFKLLLELKSGRGDYSRNNSLRPRYKDAHYIQMLLYMMLVRYNFSTPSHEGGEQLKAFLLYSKYPEGLIGLGFAPDLMFRAIRLRNRLAWMEMHYLSDTEKGYRILEKLTPESLNQKHRSDRFWVQYQSPHLASILSPVRTATELDRAYYFRLLQFIATEHRLAKVGRFQHRRQDGGFSSRWYATPLERRQRGALWDSLRFVQPVGDAGGGISGIVLRLPDKRDDGISQFRKGDIVAVYSYIDGSQPDIRKALVYRATIERIGETTLSLRLRAPQGDAAVFLRDSGKLWAIEPDLMESSYSSLYRGMHAFLSAPRERRDLLLVQRRPVVHRHLALRGEYGPMNELVLRAKRARDLLLIVGPPGTGKTSRGLIFTLREELLEPGTSVLLLAYTNQAVDAICSSLEGEGTDYIRLGSEFNCDPAYRSHLLERRAGKCQSRDSLHRLLTSVRLYVATTTAMTSHISLLDIKTFTLSIIDEASQILEPHLMALLCATNGGSPAIRRFVLIGDHKQLPAVVCQPSEISQVSDVSLHAIGLTDCRRSLFERLFSIYHDDPEVVYMLCRQGRMHPDIAQFPNKVFYGGNLLEVPLEHQCRPSKVPCRSNHIINRILSRHRVAFIHIAPTGQEEIEGVNSLEADMVVATVIRIYIQHRATFEPRHTVGVIVPYRSQVAAIRQLLACTGIPALREVTVDTVERFQGSQREAIVYGTTVRTTQGLSFLTSGEFCDVDGSIVDRRLNVAMTRAMNHLIIIGNAELLSGSETYRRLIDFLRRRDSYFAPEREAYIWGDALKCTF